MLGYCDQRSPNASRQEVSLSRGLRADPGWPDQCLGWEPLRGSGPVVSWAGGKELSETL